MNEQKRYQTRMLTMIIFILLIIIFNSVIQLLNCLQIKTDNQQIKNYQQAILDKVSENCNR